MEHTRQIARIKSKLLLAEQVDRQREVFGADTHNYYLGPVIDLSVLQAFEQKYQLSLPSSYSAFVTQVGQGGKSYRQSGAGPFYGIYPFGEGVCELVDTPDECLKRPCILYPEMTDAEWLALAIKFNDDSLFESDQRYTEAVADLYSGILPLGSQGCSYLHGLILNGPHIGKVVNLDLDYGKPQFSYEEHFLDWYENWLDGVISKEFIEDSPLWFGYYKAGSEQQLVLDYKNKTDLHSKKGCLYGLFNKPSLTEMSLIKVESIAASASGELQDIAIQILAKFSYSRAKPLLMSKLENNPLLVYQCVISYAASHAIEWKVYVQQTLGNLNLECTLFYATVELAQQCGLDMVTLLQPFIEHNDQSIRQKAISILQKTQ